MSHKEFFSQLPVSLWIYILNFPPFATILSYIYKAPDYGSNTNPARQHWLRLCALMNLCTVNSVVFVHC